jgi:putative transposase
MGINVSVATSRPVAKTNKYLFNLDVEKIKKLELRIAHKQKLQAIKTKRSSRWLSLQDQITKLHRKIRNIRHEFIHQLTAMIAKNHGLVFAEDLAVKEMMASASGTLENPGTDVARKRGLNRAIGRQGWRKFLGFLAYKVSWYGAGYFSQNPAYTSQKCNRCKHVSEENRETGSILFQCQKCGLEEHADVNSSKNLEEDGLASLVAKFGSITTIPLALRNQSKPKSGGKRRNLGASRRQKPTHPPSKGQAGNGDKAGKNLGSLGDSTNDR